MSVKTYKGDKIIEPDKVVWAKVALCTRWRSFHPSKECWKKYKELCGENLPFLKARRTPSATVPVLLSSRPSSDARRTVFPYRSRRLYAFRRISRFARSRSVSSRTVRSFPPSRTTPWPANA